jgi:SAM-dependent methyltransferase
MKNIDARTVNGFGKEWEKFNYSEVDENSVRSFYDAYFELFPWDTLPANAAGFDMGCGSGRWARFVAPRVGTLLCVDASAEALAVARKNLEKYSNCTIIHASVEKFDAKPDSMDFGYSLGVLHHIPDTEGGIRACVEKLKPGAPFLLYLYYALDNKPIWYRMIWRVSDIFRRVICRLPFPVRSLITEIMAVCIYLPLSRLSAILEMAGLAVENLPLSQYRHSGLYVLRNDCLDRFGTRLEKRFTAVQVENMMRKADLENIRFSDKLFWCAIGTKINTHKPSPPPE